MAKKVAGKQAASTASKVLKSGRTVRDSKTSAGSSFSHKECGGGRVCKKKR